MKNTDSSENEIMMHLFNIKSKLDNGTISYNDVDLLIGMLASEITYRNKIWKELNYAWENNGEALFIQNKNN